MTGKNADRVSAFDNEITNNKIVNGFLAVIIVIIRFFTKIGKGLLSFLQFFGIQWMRIYRTVFRKIWSFISPAAKLLCSVVKIAVITVDTLLLRSLHSFVREAREFNREVSSVWKNLIQALRKGILTFFRVLWYYICKAFKSHKNMFARALNVVLPIIAVILLVQCISYWNNSVYALNIEYGGKSMGYVAEESVYYDAMTLAKDRMADFGGDNSFEAARGYTLEVVKENQLMDVSTLCDRLIESSDNVITSACGIYVNDKFLCSIKNETDVTAILDGILGEYKRSVPEAKVSFKEDIHREQGIYPVDTLWNAGDLKNLFSSTVSENVTYTVKAGDTIEEICRKAGIGQERLRFLNPEINNKKYKLKEGAELIIATEKSYLTVELTYNETRIEPIAFTTEEIKNSKRYKGYKKVTTKGVNGQNQIVEEVSYIGGVETSRLQISTQKLSDPINEVVEIGTKEYTGYGSLTVIPTSGRFCWPAIGLNHISSGYGGRWGRMHNGVDITGSKAFGKSVVAADYGVVVEASYHSSFGNHIIIDHGDGYQTLYAHLSQMLVKKGTEVAAGQIIGLVGSTGNSTGPHLHFEVHKNGRAVNPGPYIGLK